MVLRKLAMALLSIGVILPGLTHALALRDVKTKSALGEPFRAELELSDLGDLSDEDIKVSLAQPEDFERLGIEQTFLLAELRFEVVVNREGRSFIKISSPKRVTEPFLDFIIRVTWPNNARLHQVTALLDPPASKLTRKAEPIQAPVVVKAEPVIQPVVKTVEQAIPVVSEPVAMTVTEKSYTVRKFDTLWKIARKVRPNNTVPVAQMMKALHKANPEAFIANNINLLKDGEVLRVPNLSDVQSAAQVAQQQANTPAVVQAQTTKALARQQIDATKKEKVIANTPTVAKPQMKLLAPTGQKTAQSTGLTEKIAKKEQTDAPTVVTSKKVAVEKAVKKTESYNQKLTHELSSLEQQLKLNDKKIAMQNAKLAQLEAQLKARRLAAEQAKHKDKTDLEKKAVATMACAVALQSFVSVDAHAADAPAKSGGSSMMPIIGGVVLLLVVAAIFVLKGKGKKETPPSTKPVAPTPPVAKPTAPQPVAPKPEPVVAKPEPVKPVEPPKPQDPLEEVRPYLEMERFPQAVGILTKALVQHPDRADIHIKLLEIFVKQKDRQAFDEQYAKLEVLGDLDAIVAADKLKTQLPELPKKEEKSKLNEDGHLEFQPSKPAAVVEETPSISLDDLENDFKMSLSQPNLKALDIPLAADPIELQQPEPVAAKEEAKIAELDELLGGGLEFKFDKEQVPVAPQEEHAGLDFKLDDVKFEVAEEVKPNVGTGLSLDSLDDFLAEHKIETPVEPKAPVADTSLDFESELAKFKEEKQEVDTTENLVEGFELEEFKLADESSTKENDLEFDLSADFSLDEQPVVEEKTDFNLDFDTPSVDLDDLAAKFDKQALADVDLPDEDLDFDVSVSSDDVVAELDKEFSFLATTDENATRLELARAYLEMGDRLGARDLLEEVVADGNGAQKTEAQGMLMRIS